MGVSSSSLCPCGHRYFGSWFLFGLRFPLSFLIFCYGKRLWPHSYLWHPAVWGPSAVFLHATDGLCGCLRQDKDFFSLFLNKFLRGASSALFSLFKIILNWQDRHVKIKQFYFWFLLNYSDFRICRAGGCYFIIDVSYCKLILFILNSSDMGVLRWRPYGLSYKLYGAVAAYQRETYFGLSQPKQRSLLRLGMLYYDWRTMPQSAESAIVVIVKYIVCAFHTCNALRSIGSGRLLCLSGISLTKHSLFIQGC